MFQSWQGLAPKSEYFTTAVQPYSGGSGNPLVERDFVNHISNHISTWHSVLVFLHLRLMNLPKIVDQSYPGWSFKEIT